LQIFRGKGNCIACHVGPNFTDEQFHNTGVAWRENGFIDEGRFAVSKSPRDHGAFKTPTLREVARTAPYMHDGSLATLEPSSTSIQTEAGRILRSTAKFVRGISLPTKNVRSFHFCAR
jgi:hypothetical protein